MKKNGQFVGIDEEFVPEEEKYVDESLLGDKQKTTKVLKTVGIGYLVWVAIFLVIAASITIFAFSNILKIRKSVKDTVNNTISGSSNINETVNGVLNNVGDIINNTMDNMNEGNTAMEEYKNSALAGAFNSTLELYAGKVSKKSAESLVNEISTINNKGERTITIKFEDEEITDTAGIITLLKSLTDKEYFITYEYDEGGYIKVANIAKF